MAELDEEELAVAAPEPEEEITDLNGAVRGVTLGAEGMGWEDGIGDQKAGRKPEVFGMLKDEFSETMFILWSCYCFGGAVFDRFWPSRSCRWNQEQGEV